jgi:DNA-binding GntR family transcriptional regulator
MISAVTSPLASSRETPTTSEGQLAAEFGVSRNAVRAALDLLRAEGLVERIQGTGTLVRGRKFDHSIDHLQGLVETLSGGPWTSRAVVGEALERATKDVDADVRGYARRALADA